MLSVLSLLFYPLRHSVLLTQSVCTLHYQKFQREKELQVINGMERDRSVTCNVMWWQI